MSHQVIPFVARDRGIGAWLLISGLISGVASYLLLYERVLLWQDPTHTTACDVNPWVSCGEVMNSWQASSFGFPNVFIGVAAFPLIIAIAVGLMGGMKLPRWYWGGMQAGVMFALGFCVWLWSQALYSIGTLCPYCMIVWTGVVPMAMAVTTRNIIHGVIPASTGLRKLAADWWWVVVILIYLAVIVSIVVRFPQLFNV